MAFTNRFNFYIKEMKAELRENGLDDKIKIDVNIFKNKIYTIKKILSIKLNILNLRNERQKINDILAFQSIQKCDLTKNINLKALKRITNELDITKEQLLKECHHNIISCKLLARNISINSSRQGIKDEEIQLTTCNITSVKCGIYITKLNTNEFRPTKCGKIITNDFYKKYANKNDCLKSFDAKLSGKINGWVFAKVIIGNGGHQDNAFEEAYILCDWVIKNSKKEEYFIILIDTNLIVKLTKLIKKYININNIIIGNHIYIQNYFIDNYYISDNK